MRGLAFQVIHSKDVGEAYRLAALSDVRGAFNVAADPVIDTVRLAKMVKARRIGISPALLRVAAAVAFRLRLAPVEPGWLDLALAVPLMTTEKAEKELGFVLRRSSLRAIRDLFRGLREGMGGDTPTLAQQAGGPARVREILTGLGARQ